MNGSRGVETGMMSQVRKKLIRFGCVICVRETGGKGRGGEHQPKGIRGDEEEAYDWAANGRRGRRGGKGRQRRGDEASKIWRLGTQEYSSIWQGACIKLASSGIMAA